MGTSLQQTKQGKAISNIGSMSFTFDDTDGAIKTLIESQAAEMTFAAVFIHYPDLPGSDGLCILSGRLVGPFNWTEGDRKFEFEIETWVVSREIGFALHVGDYSDQNDDAVNQPWPIVFGKPAHVKTVKIRKQREGQLKYSAELRQVLINYSNSWRRLGHVCLVDSTTEANSPTTVTGKLDIRYGSKFDQDTEIKIIIEQCVFRGTFNTADGGDVFTVAEANCPKWTTVATDHRGTRLDSTNPKVCWLATYIPLVGHWCWFGSGHFDGDGDEYGIEVQVVAQIGLKIWFDHAPLRYTPDEGYTTKQLADGDFIPEIRAISRTGLLTGVSKYYEHLLPAIGGAQKPTTGAKLSRAALNIADLMAASGGAFWGALPDASVRIWGVDPDIYVGSIIPASAINGIYCRRRIRGIYRFVPVPKRYYELHLDYPITLPDATVIHPACVFFYTPLKDRQDEEWGDDIYMTLTSTVGPNTADIIKWIGEHYTNLTMDASTFSITRAIIDEAPSHFAITSQPDAVTVM